MADEATPKDFYELFYQSSVGKRVWEDLKDEFYHRSSYVEHSATGTVFHEGERNVVLYVMAKIFEHAGQPVDMDVFVSRADGRIDVFREEDVSVLDDAPDEDLSDMDI